MLPSPVNPTAFSLPAVYPILDVASAQRRGWDLVDLAVRLAAADCHLLQLRGKQLPAGELLRLATAVQRALPATCRLLVNDRIDVALLACTAGVHLGQDDLPPELVRGLLQRPALLGYSTHHPAQVEVARAAPIDYLAIGPVFATTTKQNPDPTVGLQGVREARARYPGPLVAIGGITLLNCAAVWEAGADSVALIAGFLDTPDPVGMIGAFRRQFQLALRGNPRQSRRDCG